MISTLNTEDIDGLTGFHHACESGDSDIVSIFMEIPAALNAKVNNIRTGFHLASKKGYSDLVNVLMENALAWSL